MDVTALVHALRAARDRDTATSVLLEALLREATAALAAGSVPGAAPRGTLHLRSNGGYTDLLAVRAGGELVAGEPAQATSSTAWELLLRAGRAVLVDVEAQSWGPLDAPLVPGRSPTVAWAGHTRLQLRDRRTTHLVALPLRGAGALPVGMVALEIDAPAATGRQIGALAEVAAHLQLLVDVAAPVVCTLARRTPARPASDPLLPVIGRAMAGVVETLRAFSWFEETILLRGATGTGKSHLARWCHAQSPRRDGPFVVAHVHAVSEALREGDLFGWRRGAFTGATSDHRGRVTQAEGGTLFLDEIDKLDITAQGKLLRLLEERRYTVLGDERERHADTRFIVGTNANLEREVAAGRFLEDLYYRVCVLPIEIPPLRARTDELEAWVVHMAAAVRPPGGARVVVTPGALAALEAHAWPGNLRQLQSVVVRAIALALVAGGPEAHVEGAHVYRALAMDGARSADTPLVAAMREAAAAFVAANRRRRATGAGPLDLELTQALRGAVLSEAVRTRGDARQAFLDLGLEARLQGGNHLRTLRREQDRLALLCEAVGEPLPSDWLSPGEDPG